MNPQDTLKSLEKLAQLDIDAIHAYDLALKNIDDAAVKERMLQFEEDHRRHVEALSVHIRELGGDPPAFERDFKGFFIAGFTALRSLTGTHGALEAMETNERLTTSTYQKACEEDYSPDLWLLLKNHLADEQRHLSYIREVLSMDKKH